MAANNNLYDFGLEDLNEMEAGLPADGSVHVEPVTAQYGVLVLAGPRSRDLLQKLTDADLSTAAFPWLSGKWISVGTARTRALRVNFVGELGWELHHPIETQNVLFNLLMDAGREFELKPFGIRAMDSLRLEKSYRLIPRELSIEYAALESGLDRFVHLDNRDFVGREGLLAWQRRGFKNQLVTMEVAGVTDADARGSEPIYRGAELVGRCTSGGFGWRLGKSLALAMVPPALSAVGTELDVFSFRRNPVSEGQCAVGRDRVHQHQPRRLSRRRVHLRKSGPRAATMFRRIVLQANALEQAQIVLDHLPDDPGRLRRCGPSPIGGPVAIAPSARSLNPCTSFSTVVIS